MGQEQEAEARRNAFAPYQVNQDLLGYAKSDAIFLHCLPAHRGEEVTSEVLDGPRSQVILQAANRLYFRMALLVWLTRRTTCMRRWAVGSISPKDQVSHMTRSDGRNNDQLRPVSIERGLFITAAACCTAAAGLPCW